MTISYSDAKIRRCCLESATATKELGADSCRKLRSRLSDLKAAKTVMELVAGRPHPYRGKNEKRFSLDLAYGKRLLFVPTKDPPPFKGDGGIDWGLVTEVTIVFLGDNHDD